MKLAVFIFPVYMLETGKVWNVLDETQGKQEANEIVSCLETLICAIPNGANDPVLYSDYCLCQNHNSTVVSMLLNSIWNIELSDG
jgi:hypothetical protein